MGSEIDLIPPWMTQAMNQMNAGPQFLKQVQQMAPPNLLALRERHPMEPKPKRLNYPKPRTLSTLHPLRHI